MEDMPLVVMLMRGVVVSGTRSSTSSPYPFNPWYGLGLLVISRIVCTPRSCDAHRPITPHPNNSQRYGRGGGIDRP